MTPERLVSGEGLREKARGPDPTVTGPVVFRGREPTIHPEFFSLLQRFRGQGVDLHTNARFFYYKEAAEQAREAGLETARVSIHHPEPSGQDTWTKTPGSFHQMSTGVRHLVEAGVSVWLRIVVRRGNTPTLSTLVDRAAEWGCTGVRFVALPARDGEGPLRAHYLAVAQRLANDRGLGLETHGVPEWVPFLSPSCRDAPSKPLLSGEPPPQKGDPEKGEGGISRDLEIPPGEKEENGVCVRGGREQVEVVVRTLCANACNFCTTRILHEELGNPWVVDRGEALLRGLEEELARDPDRGVRFVAIEPLEHPDALVLIDAARRLSGRGVWVGSSGRRLSDSSFAQAAVACGLGTLELPLFGPDASTHDEVAGRRGAFEETLRGIENLNEAGFRDLRFHMVLVKQNIETLFDTAALAGQHARHGLTGLTLAAPASWRLGRYGEVAFSFDKALASLASQAPDHPKDLVEACLRLLPVKVPFCLLRRHFPDSQAVKALYRQVRSLSSCPPSAGSLGGAEEAASLEQLPEKGALLKARRLCPHHTRCAARSVCSGLYPEHISLFGIDALTPL